MHTDSSASRTCRLSRSASLNTATVAMSSSRQARITRNAISPRLAISTFLNKGRPRLLARHPLLLRRRAAGGTAGTRSAGAGLVVALGRLDRLPRAVRGAGEALELQAQLVRVVAVPERFLLCDEPLAQQRQHALIERLHAV